MKGTRTGENVERLEGAAGNASCRAASTGFGGAMPSTGGGNAFFGVCLDRKGSPYTGFNVVANDALGTIVRSDGAAAWEALAFFAEEGIVVVGVYGFVFLPRVVLGGGMEVVVGVWSRGNGFP